MTVLYAVGGRQKAGITDRIEEWHHYGAAVVVQVDVATGQLKQCVEYVSPPEACANDLNPSILFKSATLEDGVLYVPTQTEVLLYRVPSFERIGYISLPRFNDLHHVRPGRAGTLLVVNTGLDSVLELGRDGSVLREWSVLDEDIWKRFDRDVDYRKVVSTKPHLAHPNNVFFLGDEVWVTRCDQRDIRCLTQDHPPVVIADKYIHDGVRFGDRIFFTAVNGEVIVLDVNSRQVIAKHDLNQITGGPPVGWCRGIEVLDDEHVVVGFSRLRPTKWEQNVKWLKHQLGGSGHGLRSTGLAMYNLRLQRLVWEIDLEPAGMNVIFSVHRAEAAR